MIKILRDGYEQKPTIRIYTVTCPSCGCVFECDYHDFAWQSKGLILDAGIRCPHCSQEIHVGSDTPCRVEFEEK